MGDSSIKSLLRIDDDAGPQKIGFLLLNQFSMIAFASAVEPLRAANRQANKVLFEWVVTGPDGQGSTASNGMLLQTNTGIEALRECCMVFVCAGIRVRENTNKAILNLIRRLDRNGAVIPKVDEFRLGTCRRHFLAVEFAIRQHPHGLPVGVGR